jgi:hypothetical protein
LFARAPFAQRRQRETSSGRIQSVRLYARPADRMVMETELGHRLRIK